LAPRKFGLERFHCRIN